MVSTRHHPRPFPEPALPTSSHSSSSPTKDTPPSPTTSAASTARTRSTSKRRVASSSDSTALTPTKQPTRRKKQTATTTTSTSSYIHTPPSLLLTWLLVSLPLVIWDTLYVLGRPHTMPGGKFHSPFWTPYALYGTIDYVYGWPAWNANNGFTAAQGSLNTVETIMYGWYLFIVTREVEGGWRGVLRKLWREGSEGKVTVQGNGVDTAVLVCFAGAVMTVSKTVLYWLNEAFSGFDSIGHNTAWNLVFLWIIPNGAWLALPSYMIYILGREILAAMHGESMKKAD